MEQTHYSQAGRHKLNGLFGAVQMCSGSDVTANLAAVGVLLRAARDQGCELVVLPENFALMAGTPEARLLHAEEDRSGPIQKSLRDWCREFGLWLVAGTIPMRCAQPTKVRSACLVFDDRGERVARYDKIHLFDVDLGAGERYVESDGFEPGTTPVVVATPFGRLGLAVCYDLRFPELFRALLSAGAEIISLPAAFTVPTGQAHWDVLVRARAIENSCYVIASAQVGRHDNGRTTYGHSMIVDPWGAVMNCKSAGTGIVSARFEHERVEAVRQRLPSITHRRL
ncbi:MAG TPA: carbon-nitrogen hydrolase family protein [Acidiferrobacter sp.]|nr:carbon-nitrogen hydrolase family protein [Acidiferrobacter sp.]